jgi:quercetin dioxygenase-like cupin family protein
MSFFKDSELKSRELLKGVDIKAVYGEKTMLTIFNFEPNAIIPQHKHLHEQISYVIKGELEFTLQGNTQILKEGEGVVVKSNLEHSAKVLTKPTKVIDAWYPMREDYK